MHEDISKVLLPQYDTMPNLPQEEKQALQDFRCKISRGFPVAEHFNSDSCSLDDIMVCGLKQCTGSSISHRQHEMKLIFKLGTVRSSGRNINFNFL